MSDTGARVFLTMRLAGVNEEPQIHAARSVEELSRPFRWEVDFDATAIDVDALRGKTAELDITDVLGNEHNVSGIVLSIDALASDSTEARSRWRVTIVPKALLLSFRHGFRIFQEMTAVEIVQKVFQSAGLEATLLELHLTGTYPKRESCTQYDESEWDFVCRLMEEEGIWFRFRHGSDGHVMELWDDSTMAPKLDPVELPFVTHHDHGGESLRVWDWVTGARASVAKSTLRDYDPLHPAIDLTKQAEASGDPFSREHYEFPGGYFEPPEGQRLATTRLEELRSRHRTARAMTNVLHGGPGQRVTLTDHPFADGEYLVTRTALKVRLVSTDRGDALFAAGDEAAECELTVVPAAQRYRPARTTPRPRIMGLQTALVTGPAGEEVHCDEHGRVKVQFHWDPDGKLDEHTSCWIRTGQQHTTGSVMIPRIGWEILVEFIEGDPDRPLALSRLYNPTFPPTYELPLNKTMTGIRSESSPGRGGVNEVTFDDAAGSEMLAINANHDINVKAANNKQQKIGNVAERSVGANRKASTGSNQTVSVGTCHAACVTGDHTVNVGVNREVKVSAGSTYDVKADFTLKVGAVEMLMIGNPVGAVIELIAGKAINAAVGAAAGLASKTVGKLAGPIAAALGPAGPALARAQQAMGAASQFAGPAAALFGGGNPTVSAFASAAGTMSSIPGVHAAGHIGTELALHELGHMAQHQLEHAVHGGGGAGGGHGAGAGGAGGGGGGGGGGGRGAGGGGGSHGAGGGGGASGGTDGDGGLDASGSGGSGSGSWTTVVGGNMTEKIGAAHALATPRGSVYSIAAGNTEMIGAARVTIAKMGITETIGAAKVESVGITMWSSSLGINVDATGAVLINAGAMKQSIGKGHAMTAKSAAMVTTSKATLKGADGLTLKCGESEIAIGSSGIKIKSLKVTVDAPEILVDPAAIGP